MQQGVTGTLTLDGARLAGVEVVLTDDAGVALASQATDAAGEVRFDRPGFTGGWIVARLHEPIVGAAAKPVPASGAKVELALDSASAATLAVTVKPPAGVRFDWAMLKATPRAVPGVPDPVIAAAWLVGTGPSIRGAFHEVRLTSPEARLRVLPGTWGIAVAHIVERAPSLDPPPPNWVHDALVRADGTRVPSPTGEHRVDVAGDLSITLESKIFDDGVPHGKRP